jgi:hypothetical protein
VTPAPAVSEGNDIGPGLGSTWPSATPGMCGDN